MTSWEAFQQIRSVRDELLAADFALAFSLRQAEVDTSLLHTVDGLIGVVQLRRCAANLESTYMLRLFSSFEGILRDYWLAVRPARRARQTRMEVLMNRIVILRQIPHAVAQGAHDVRAYRNWLVHPQAGYPRLTFSECKSRLGYFLSYLPREW